MKALLLAAVAVVASAVLAAPANAQAGACATPPNEIVAENCRIGAPKAEWEVQGAGDPGIQGYATDLSVDQGDTVDFKIDTVATDYRLDIYRMGYYGGDGARKVDSIEPTGALFASQPDCLTEDTTGLVDCGNWSVSASWNVPVGAVSGIYFARLVREDLSGGASHVFFIVRDDDGASDVLFQTSDTTWQAYNRYGGNSLYTGEPAGRAYKVSYNRPFTTREYAPEDWVFNAEYPMVRWLERNGYDVSYFTGIDSDRFGAELLEHDVFLSVGHDEYWSAAQRTNVEAARAAGTSMAFLSGNEVYWKTRWEASISADATARRTLVSYKETHAGAKIDPEPNVWTGTWRDPRFSPPADGGRPENALTGQLFIVNDGATTSIEVPAADGKLRFWRGTSIAGLAAGETAVLPHGTLGYEWDVDADNGHRPAGSMRLSTTTVENAPILVDHGSTFGRGTATHNMTLYRHTSGALVFGAGTVQWPWGLDSNHDRGSEPADPRMKQATVNVLADMRVQPATLDPALTPATASTDVTPPTSSITSPVDGVSAQIDKPIEINGSAADGEAGKVGGVEVSTDNGQTWHPAAGRESWRYVWTPDQLGTATLRVRAVDDSGNLQSATTATTVEVVESIPVSCPCTIFDQTATPVLPSLNDGSPLEVGVKFRSDDDGYVTGLRFYKGAQNTGTHVGHLWSATGQRLAEATFTSETASGWQEVTLARPVPVARDATYVASYHSSNGGYAADEGFFANSLDNTPLHALANGADGGNGVYRYGASGFPASTWNASNYWVDVVFEHEIGPDTRAPQVTSVSPTDGAGRADTGVTLGATFSEPLDPATVSSATFKLTTSDGTPVPATVSYDDQSMTVSLDPTASLAEGTNYTARLAGGTGGIADTAGNTLAADYTWSFRTWAPPSCPCTLFDTTAAPTNPNANDGRALEVGVKFRSEIDGYVSGIRFYKGVENTGTHIGRLWTRGGRKLAEATFTSETVSGWQQVLLNEPVPVSANVTYVVSYHSPTGVHALDEPFFAVPFENPPLTALADGVDGGNGVYRYGSGGFPTSTWGASNYWVDVVFERDNVTDTTPPAVNLRLPVAGAKEVVTTARVYAGFNEIMNAATIDGSTVTLRDAGGTVVPATVSFDAAEQTATLVPNAQLAYSSTYSVTVKGGASGVADRAGNRLAQDHTWTFETEPPPPPPPTVGPGGPVLVVGSSDDPFDIYYAEILRAEGLNEFDVTDIASVTAATLANYQVVVLGGMPLSDAQVAMLTSWVQSGGNLVAMHPDKKLAGLLGLTDAASTLPEGYLRVETSSLPGRGITGQTMQFHGTADRYTLAGAREIAKLYSDGNSATPHPAVTLNAVGTAGGQAAAFTYDLARSIVYTRQGNPAWVDQERDGLSPLRSDDLFFGAAAGNVRPDWVDFDKIALPQADEQQRLLANLVTHMNLDRTPLPRFWYLPRGENAAVVMTGDDHAHNGTAGQFERFKDQSDPGCSVADWECIRATSYLYPNTPLSDVDARNFENQGFEIALHVSTGCANFTRQELDVYFDQQLADFAGVWPSLTPPRTNRTHCIAYSGWSSTPRSSLAHGIRLDTNYYYWPAGWVQDRPGHFTGSAMPMRFADLDGSMIDVYQAVTQLTDESGQNLRAHSAALLDNAVGPQGYYGVITTNMHTDDPVHAGADAIVAEAKARGVPVVTARQMLTWLDGRNSSSFDGLSFNQGELRFTLDRAAGARGLQAMVPVLAGGPLASLTRDGVAVTTTERMIKGVRYAMFDAAPGAYVADYDIDATAPVITNVAATARVDGTAEVSWTTNEPADSHVAYGTSATALSSEASDGARVTNHEIQLSGLTAGTTYHFRVTSTDNAENSSTSPATGSAPATFGTPVTITDSAVGDFAAGTRSATYVGASDAGADGEVQLQPTVGEEFDGTVVPAGWSVTSWTGGTGFLSSSALVVDGARAGTTATYASGRSVEFTATLGAQPFRHVGFGVDFGAAPWGMFSTGGGSLPVSLYARTAGTGTVNTPLSGVSASSPQRFRIDWTSTGLQYFVNGTQVASHNVAVANAMRPLASDYQNGSGDLRVHWLRMSPYASAGTFTSRVLNATGPADWTTLEASRTVPSGTAVSFETRTGSTATPDGSWSAWAPVGADGTIASPHGAYLQYRATLTTTSDRETPTVGRVDVGYVPAP